ncbi:DUF488 domain-containing protein [Aequorivita antarctica]|uniref:DUF488 domain-containing protein n=1 Tax=Aequorivita antarctica TaxID=153266 RepID=UPI000DBBD271|nr:hypothetical protein AEQU3_01397 [Aequorivita antarctica]
MSFQKKYKKELDNHSALVEELLNKTKVKRLTLLYGAKDENHNQAIVLKQFLENQ